MATFLISLVVAVPLGVAANLLTPVVRSALDKRSASRRTMRIASIRKQQELLAGVRAQPSRAVGELGIMMTRLLPLWAFSLAAGLGSLFSGLGTTADAQGVHGLLEVIFPLMLLYTAALTNGALIMFRKMASPEWADRQTEQQLRKLGAEHEAAPGPEPVIAPGQPDPASPQPAPDSGA